MKNHMLSMLLWCICAIALGASTILIPSLAESTRNLLAIATVVAICGLSVEFDRGHSSKGAEDGSTKSYFASLHNAA